LVNITQLYHNAQCVKYKIPIILRLISDSLMWSKPAIHKIYKSLKAVSEFWVPKRYHIY